MPDYRYELREGAEILSTGHLTLEVAVHTGEPLVLGGRRGIVMSVEPILGEHELRLVVQAGPADATRS